MSPLPPPPPRPSTGMRGVFLRPSDAGNLSGGRLAGRLHWAKICLPPPSTRLLSGGQMPFYCYLFSSSDGASQECQPSSATVIEDFIFLIPPSLCPVRPAASPPLVLAEGKGLWRPPATPISLETDEASSLLLPSSSPLLPVLPPSYNDVFFSAWDKLYFL